jgi:GH35 family endo-1,4-beta-xylanase
VFDRDEYSWKDELRDQIENAKAHTSNLETFSEHLKKKGLKLNFVVKQSHISLKMQINGYVDER